MFSFIKPAYFRYQWTCSKSPLDHTKCLFGACSVVIIIGWSFYFQLTLFCHVSFSASQSTTQQQQKQTIPNHKRLIWTYLHENWQNVTSKYWQRERSTLQYIMWDSSPVMLMGSIFEAEEASNMLPHRRKALNPAEHHSSRQSSGLAQLQGWDILPSVNYASSSSEHKCFADELRSACGSKEDFLDFFFVLFCFFGHDSFVFSTRTDVGQVLPKCLFSADRNTHWCFLYRSPFSNM